MVSQASKEDKLGHPIPEEGVLISVPEPGSILRLGSGLMGLAGYAGLRWRTRQ
jgi:hypothetical protein